MKGFLKSLATVFLIIAVLSLGTFSALCEEKTLQIKEENLTLSVSEDYILLNDENAAKNSEKIEILGYTLSSFKTYLSQNNIVVFGLDTKNKTQLILKSFETDFSKDIIELSLLNEDALLEVTKKLVTIPEASWRIVKINDMQMIEVRFSDQDQNGEFYTVMYITIRNGKIYSLSQIFSGEKSETKTSAAFSTVKGLEIKDVKTSAAWDASSVFEFIIIWIMIIGAFVAAVFIIVSFVRDRKKYKENLENGKEVISRRR